ncbi:MAG: glycosyl hydrolase, partial [Verrucomicrobiota bacterium]
PKGVPAGVDFVPMIWGYWGNQAGIAKTGAAAKEAGINELLGFNEPDHRDQSNLTVEKALAAWPELMKTGMRLGSPGCAHPDGEWMKEFMAGVEKQKLRVDFICVHSYGGTDANAFMKKLQSVHKLFARPLWITEFACGDWQAKSVAQNRHKPEQVLKFMEQVLPQLESSSFVERYAWFPAGADSAALGTSALFDKTGELTPLGKFYQSV